MLGGVGVVAGRRVDDVEGESECLVEHLGDDAGEEGAGQFEAGVGVDFYEPGIELTVYHEVQSKYLEVMLVSFRRQFYKCAFYCVQADAPHSREDPFLEVVVLFRVGSVQVLLELRV